MPGKPDGDTPSIATLVARARASFVAQIADHVHAREELVLAAFNNAISELVAELQLAAEALVDTAADNARARAELDAVQALGKRHSFSASDVCGRCAHLAPTLVGARLAGEGDTCSRCGAVVCVQREDETEAHFRARVRNQKLGD
jgi:hypothetical protein